MSCSPVAPIEDFKYFKIRFPELADRGDALIQMILSETEEDFANPCWVDPVKKRARMYLAAHLLTTQGGDFITNGVEKRRKVGDVEVEMSGPSSKGSGYYGTPYGSEYLALVRATFPAVLIV